MHYLELPAAVVDWSVAAEEDALEGLSELRTEDGVNNLQGELLNQQCTGMKTALITIWFDNNLSN